MSITFDPVKNAANIAKHGLSFADFEGFDGPAVVVEDGRKDYGEKRFRTFGRIGGKPHMIAYVILEGGVRLISFRRAHEKELCRYE